MKDTVFTAYKDILMDDLIENNLKELDVIDERNRVWRNSSSIPKWVNLNETGLDRFFTAKKAAKECYKSMLKTLKKDGVNISECVFIEPSAGDGSFFDLLPKEARIGIDIYPSRDGLIKADFLSWIPNLPKNKKIVVIGNPPFGYRAWLALAFLNHALTFADYVGFILPMAFQSDGKGSPKYRVKNAGVYEQAFLKDDAFYQPNGKKFKLNSVWQIWKKGIRNKLEVPDVSAVADIFTVDIRKERLCGQEKMESAFMFLQRTYFGEFPRPVKNIQEVKYGCGYGFVFKENEHQISEYLAQVNWLEYSNVAAHNARHISMFHIKRAIFDGGFVK